MFCEHSKPDLNWNDSLDSLFCRLKTCILKSWLLCCSMEDIVLNETLSHCLLWYPIWRWNDSFLRRCSWVTGGWESPVQYNGCLLCLIPDGSPVSFEGAIAMPCFSVLPETWLTRLIDVDWLVSALVNVSTWRNSGLSVLWPFVFGLSSPTVWGFFKTSEVLERMRSVFIAWVRSHVVDIGQDTRIFEGTKAAKVAWRTAWGEGARFQTSCGPYAMIDIL